MEEINSIELEKINGGSISTWAIFGTIIGAVFIIGIFDGYTRPLACN